MVTIVDGNLFDSSAQTLVNPVNCVGVMGAGIAVQFKKRFPDMFEEYARLCRRYKMVLGRPYLHKRAILPWVLSFPTKDHWYFKSRLQDLVAGLKCLRTNYAVWGIESLAMPALGCGRGGLDWNVVRDTIIEELGEIDIPVYLYEPHD